MSSKQFLKSLGLLLAIVPMQLWSSNLYILFDSGCMDRLEYSYQNLNGGKPYIVYHVNASPTEKIILEIGSETQSFQKDLPGQLIKCDNAIFDRRLVKEINSKIDQIFLVIKKGNRKYYVSPVRFAAYYKYTGDNLTYLSPKYSFNFNYQKATIGENISYNNPKAEVYFEGQMESDCSGQLLFRQITDNSGEPLTDLVFIPELGVVEERSGLDVDDALNNTLRLQKINGKTLNRYLKDLCKDEVASLEPEFVPRNIPQPSNGIDPLPIQNTDYPVLPLEMEASDGIHLVKKGETLYGISKQHRISVTQLKDWNNIGSSNIIYRGDRLKVVPPSSYSYASTVSPSSSSVSAKDVQVYEDPVSRRIIPFASNTYASVKSGEPVHVVKQGETVPYLALKYGFTENKFRQINNLRKSDFIRVGQPLRITDCDCPPVSQLVVPTESSYVSSSDTRRSNYESSYNARLNDYEAQLKAKSPAEPTYRQDARNTPTFYGADPLPSSMVTEPYTHVVDAQDLRPLDNAVPQSFDAVSNRINTRPAGNRTIHQVTDGDTLYKIARNYGTTVQRLRDLNNLELNEILIPYQRIFIN